LIATANQGKVREIQRLLGDLPIAIRTLADFPVIKPVDESGDTYEANALLKAKAYAKETGLCALADDSGFEVMALDGRPGVFSARYAGAGASDGDRISLLLQELKDSKSNDTRARFVCVAALADPHNDMTVVAQGICEGIVVTESRGKNGFGYDPIFVPDGFKQTFAELSGEIKNAISHRARAIHSLRNHLEALIGRR
jgi:XTP/dITP diphosphohydrolase